MAGRQEILSPEGLRLDGRRPGELRQLRTQLGTSEAADGSAYIEQGNTAVLAVVYGPHEADSKWQHDKAVLSCEFSLATFSGTERKQRSNADKRNVETGLRIGKTLESAVWSHLHPRSKIDVFIQVLQADGGVEAAAINAACLALMDAGIPMKGFISACTASHADGVEIVDVNGTESSQQRPEITLATFAGTNEIALCHMQCRLHVDQFDNLVQAAQEGCATVAALLARAVDERLDSVVTH